MKEKNNSEEEVSENIYRFFSFKKNLLLFFITLIVFVISFLRHFPAKSLVEEKIQSALSQLQGCSISYNRLELSFFLPRIEFKDLTIAENCLQNSTEAVVLESIYVRPSFPGIFPLGLRLYLEVKMADSQIRSSIRLGFNGSIVTIEKSTISTSTLNQFVGQGPIFVGDIALEGNVELKNNNLKQGALTIQSNNIATQNANIQGIGLPELNIGLLDIRLNLNDKQLLTLEKADIGLDNADIIAKFKGTINFNMNDLISSQVNIEGSFFLGQKITEAISLINFFLQNKNVDSNGFYSLRLAGPMGALSPEIL